MIYDLKQSVDQRWLFYPVLHSCLDDLVQNQVNVEMVLHNLELLGVDPDQSWVVDAENTGRVASIFFSVDLQHTIGVGDSADGETVDT